LQGVDCTIRPGEFVALLGLNGAGKSTLLRSLVGLTPLQQGKIVINGVTIAAGAPPRSLPEVAMLFQGGGLIRQLSALENVLCGYLGQRSTWQTLFGFGHRDRQRALELLAHLGLADQADQSVRQLSGGQQQRVAIARALIQSPTILLVDEPVTGLDINATHQVMEILRQLQQQGITILAVLHDLELAAAYCDRAIVLAAGRIIYDGVCQNLPAYFT
jgi:phosphonate transport system ATP-binding protein